MRTAQGTIFHKPPAARPPVGGVGQDNGGHSSARTKQRYASAATTHDRAEVQTSKPPHSLPRQKMTFRVDPKAAAEIRRKSEDSKISVTTDGEG